ncbi:uncharacterized protein F5147DRAFT_365927 [Suillus discolor]|uniref:Uncharacterized protein n=1 Tax=Suillus discolor TaxID=1912936 RepID=A0A9P7F013_9AGAM|nr:uncharacterized protein F5147DRAFT_365927 [Suillus discolor]KAG2097725.1 hypothetical protein F5147DRAFT_365927 [Suillus discolor]
MLRLLCIALSLFLSLQLAVADPVSTVLRVPRHSKSSSLVLTKSVLSALLVRRGKFTARQGCPSGYQQCTNYPDACAPVGSFCCNDVYNCPDDTTCFESECCPNTAQTCNGHSCCNPGSECCNDDSCCESGYSCCNDSTGGCCPTGTTCIAGSDQCSTGGPTGGGGTGVLTSVAVTTSSKSTVQPKTASSSSHTSTINEPTTTKSSSTSSTASSTGSTSSGFPQVGAAPRGIALVPGKQLVVLAAVVGLPILHNVVQAL